MLKSFCDKNTGEIEGKVGPKEGRAIIRVYNATDTATAIPDRDVELRYVDCQPESTMYCTRVLTDIGIPRSATCL